MEKRIDPSTIQIENVPPPLRRRQFIQSKYAELFSRLPVNQCLVCTPDDVATIEKALSQWIRKEERSDLATQAEPNCDDGKGRIWLVQLTAEEQAKRAESRRKRAVRRQSKPRNHVITPDPDRVPGSTPVFNGLGARARH